VQRPWLRSAAGRLAGLVAAFALLAIPAAATAAARANALTISATPNMTLAGEAVLVYGQLKGADRAGQTIRLFHRINPATTFTRVSSTTTDPAGFYEFVRADGIATTNRSWYVVGPGGVRSRVVHERVSALVSLAVDNENGTTGRPFTFTGALTPAGHTGEPVALQKLVGGSGSDWTTVTSGLVGADSTFSFTKAFAVPGSYELRVWFAGDGRNTPASSDLLTVVVQQAENPSFTIATSAPVVDPGQSVTLSGVLYEPASPTTPQPGRSITLWGHRVGQPGSPITTATTGGDGSYSFSVTPTANMVFVVHATGAPAKQLTTRLFEGVEDVVALSASAASASVGQSLTLTGTVSPDKAGHVVDLEQLGSDGTYHLVTTRFVNNDSTFQFGWTPGTAGTKSLRAEILGGPENLGGVSPAVTITVNTPPVSSLPAA
jgi:hypothetical protein